MEKDERAVHVERMGKKDMLTVILGNAEVQTPRRKTRHRWEDDINVNLKEIGWKGVDWINLVQDVDK
jgi:hypothetical protein